MQVNTCVAPFTESRTSLLESRLLDLFSSEVFLRTTPLRCTRKAENLRSGFFLTPASSRTTRDLRYEARPQSFRHPGDRQPRRCSRKAVARDYPRLTGYGYVMQQALPPPPLSRAE